MFRCPNCNAMRQIHRSRFRNWERILALVLHRPYRCYPMFGVRLRKSLPSKD